jgi:hypothetical protein
VLVQNVGVQTRVHALARSASGERATTAEESLKRSKGVDVVRGNWEALESEVDMCESRLAAQVRWLSGE